MPVPTLPTILKQQWQSWKMPSIFKNMSRFSIKWKVLDTTLYGKEPFPAIFPVSSMDAFCYGKISWQLAIRATTQRESRTLWSIELWCKSQETVQLSFIPVGRPDLRKLWWSATITTPTFVTSLPGQQAYGLLKRKEQQEFSVCFLWVTLLLSWSILLSPSEGELTFSSPIPQLFKGILSNSCWHAARIYSVK